MMSAGESPWQFGRCEVHGGIAKRMLTHMDQDRPIDTAEDFQCALRQTKNSLSRSRTLPGSLVSDEQVTSHVLAEDGSPLGSDNNWRQESQRAGQESICSGRQ